MLPRQNRFHGHSSLRYVFSKGMTYRSRYFLVRFVANKKRHDTRLAVIVSKKIYKSAVKRNRIRRRMYNIVRHELGKLPQVYDITITVFSGEILVLPHDQLVHELGQATAFIQKASPR